MSLSRPFAALLIATTVVFRAAAAEPKAIPADKAKQHSQLVIKLQAKQLDYFALKEQIDSQRKEFEKKADAELEKRIAEFQAVQSEYQKFLEMLRKISGAKPNCTLDENSQWKCPDDKK